MQINYTLYHQDGTEITYIGSTVPDVLRVLQSHVDGHIEIAERTEFGMLLIVNEDGLFRKDLSRNLKFPRYVGNVVMIHEKYLE